MKKIKCGNIGCWAFFKDDYRLKNKSAICAACVKKKKIEQRKGRYNASK